MNRLELEGIPYFGDNTLDIEKQIKEAEICHTKVYDDMWELIQNEATENKVVVIADDSNCWLSYLRDIRFNYRDKLVFIPYFTYDIHSVDRGRIKSNYKGHIVLNEDTIDIRYNYKFNILDINEMNKIITLYDLDTNKKYNVTFKKWLDKQEFDIEYLYNLYLNSCIDEEDYRLVKHTEGYHLINKKINGVKNKEKELREAYGLSHRDYSGVDMSILNYRDVRNYTSDQYIAIKGIPLLDISYWKRILDFECLIFCILIDNIKPAGKIRDDWDKLGKTRRIIKYGKDIKLIIKDYWVSNKSNNTNKTWSRI